MKEEVFLAEECEEEEEKKEELELEEEGSYEEDRNIKAISILDETRKSLLSFQKSLNKKKQPSLTETEAWTKSWMTQLGQAKSLLQASPVHPDIRELTEKSAELARHIQTWLTDKEKRTWERRGSIYFLRTKILGLVKDMTPADAKRYIAFDMERFLRENGINIALDWYLKCPLPGENSSTSEKE